MDNALKQLKTCIVGCGRIASRHFAAASEHAAVVGCSDIRIERAKAFAAQYHCNAYEDYREMLEKERPDVLHICLPHDLHVPVTEYAVSRGIAVLCEKPMAIDYASAVHAVELAEEAGVCYGVVFQCRYNDASQAVKRALDSGKLGKILFASSTLIWTRPASYYAESDWKGTAEREGGGVVIDQAIHSIDLVNWLVNAKVEHVSCSMANHGHPYLRVEDAAEGLITYENGVKYVFFCTNNYGANEPIEIKLLCENGKVTFNYDEAHIVYHDGTREDVVQENPDPKKHSEPHYWGYRHTKQIEQFYRAVQGLEPLEISAREALKTQKLICDIYHRG